jgi:hypothetical protein
VKDLTGLSFGRLVVESYSHTHKTGHRKWNCVCECGNKKTVLGGSLTRGETKSCGCSRIDSNKERGKHNKSHLPEYQVWKAMNQRCSNKNNHAYSDYGGRGITVCEEWKDFGVFIQQMGERPTKNHTLERVNNNKGYNSQNCEWELRPIQSQNRRYSKLSIEKAREIRLRYTYGDITQKELGEMYEVSESTIASVLKNKSWIE